MKKLLLVMILGFSASAVADPSPASLPLHQVGAGSQVIIQKDLVFLPQIRSLKIQDGALIKNTLNPLKRVPVFGPHCWIKLKSPSQKSRKLAAGTTMNVTAGEAHVYHVFMDYERYISILKVDHPGIREMGCFSNSLHSEGPISVEAFVNIAGGIFDLAILPPSKL